jgi:hypothetical protein
LITQKSCLLESILNEGLGNVVNGLSAVEVTENRGANGLPILDQGRTVPMARSRPITHNVLGLRNSHDKRFPAGLVGGSAVFVCDNLAFSGEAHDVVATGGIGTPQLMRSLTRDPRSRQPQGRSSVDLYPNPHPRLRHHQLDKPLAFGRTVMSFLPS